MFNIDKLGNISMARGDTAEFFVNVCYGRKDNHIKYKLEETDTVLFAVFDTGNRYNENIIEKTYTIADLDEYDRIKMSFEEEDTMYLPVKNYWYVLKLFKADEQGNIKPYTITNKKQFNIDM